MAVIALTLAPALTVALTLTLASEGALVTLTNPAPGAAAHTLTLAPAGPVVLAAVAELLRGPKGEPGAAGAMALGATYTQSDAAAIWTVPHNLDRYPGVTVTDHLGNVISADVSYVDSNIVRITHGMALTGTVYLN